MVKSNILFSLLLTSLLSIIVKSDDDVTTTITHTNYITPAWFSDAIETILADNPKNVNNGIPIVFVNGQITPSGSPVTTDAPAISTTAKAPQINTVISSSQVSYAVSTDSVQYNTITECQDGKCSTQLNSEKVPYIYTTWAYSLFTTTITNADDATPTTNSETSDSQTGTGKERSTIYQYDTVTDSSNVFKLITKTAHTTTKTIFTATETPTTTYEPSTTVETITKTIQNPLVTGSVVTKTQTKTINTDFSEDVTITKTEPSSSSSNNETYVANLMSSSFESSMGVSSMSATTSTIDLRISSTESTHSSVTPFAKMYSNSSEEFSSWLSSSSELSSSASLAPSIHNAAVSSSGAASSAPSSSSLGASSSAPSSSSSGASSSVASSASSSASSKSAATSIAKTPSNSCASDLFQAISEDSPISVFKRDELPLAIPSGADNNGVPYQTNKFFSNLILDDQTDMIWSYPYGMFWKTQDYYGFGVQHTNASDRIFGPKNANNDGDSYFSNPTNNAELLISATTLSNDSNYLGVSDMKTMSVKVTLSSTSNVGSDYIEIPIVQGMGFVTSIYHGDMTPLINTLIGVSNLKQETSDALLENILKYRVTLFNDIEYLVYVYVPSGESFELSAKDSFHVEGSKAIDGLIIQMAVAPSDSSNDGYYDEAAGAYPVSASITGSASGSSASYSFAYDVKGTSSSGNTMVFALPHHVSSVSSETDSDKTPIKLYSTTKGEMTGFLTNTLTLEETLTSDVDFLPWAPLMSKDLSYTKEQLTLLASTAQDELNVDIKLTVENMNSNYFSGKVIDKYAQILLVVYEILGDEDFSKDVLQDMKDAFEVFTSNEQYYPLMYDTKYGGITSTASQNGDTGADYGSAYYNDHHFHYGYFIHAAAVVGYIDGKLNGTWAEDNKDWVNNLIRDVANPSEDDSYFPVSRMFDWFAGHSWASGLFASGDGRNEESSSEDYHFSFGMKLWGKVIGDCSMESRGDLMLAIMKRAMNDYFYFSDDNKIIPEEMIPNKVSGIFFDNKIAFTTYFGDSDTYPQYVHGIHMVPMTAAAALIRGADYVKQEWNDCIESFITTLTDGWAGILRLNQALFDPENSYKFFSSDDFQSVFLDNGQSRTWSLAFSGGIYNSQ